MSAPTCSANTPASVETVQTKLDMLRAACQSSGFDYEKIGKYAPLVVDTRNAMSRVPNPTAAIVKA